jgi:hypothetical protein
MGDPLSPYQFHYDSGQFMNKNDDDVSESKLFLNLTKFLLKKGLSEKLIPIYYKEKLGLEITDDEKNTIKGIKYILNDIVNNITLDDELDNGRRWFKSNIDEYNKKFVIQGNQLTIIFKSIGDILRQNNINYYNGMAQLSNKLFLNMLNKKFPKLNLVLADFVIMFGEDNYKW